MELQLTEHNFAQLLDRLGADGNSPGEEYEALRRTLTRFFEWRGAPFPDEHTDETLDRVAKKLDEGIAIQNLAGYSHEVARLVFLEAVKRERKAPRADLDEIETVAAPMVSPEAAAEKEQRLSCLDACLASLNDDHRDLITNYYRDETHGQIDHRKALAERLGLRREALANRAQRVRDKLEQCVTRCTKRKMAI